MKTKTPTKTEVEEAIKTVNAAPLNWRVNTPKKLLSAILAGRVLVKEVERLRNRTCEWKLPLYGHYQTSCIRGFDLPKGDHPYCPGCGGKIEVKQETNDGKV